MEQITTNAVTISEQYEIISDMMHALHINEKTLNARTANWEDIGLAYMRHVISMQEENEGLCLVAYVNEQPAGFIFGYTEVPDDSRIEEYTGRELYVSDGYVKPEYRRRGIYQQLNNALEQHFIALGIKRITRFTMVNNSGMRSLLEQQGYAVSRVLYEKWL
jgi:ribosomal protein S18 acetylase RimI-like enzyme